MTKVGMLRAGLLCGATLAGTVTAHASVIAETYNFSLSNFTNGAGTDAAPSKKVTGSVTVSYDPTTTKFDSTTGVTLDSLNGVTLGSAIAYTSYKAADGQELLYLGGVQSGAAGLAPSTSDFVLALDVTNPAAPFLLQCSSPYESCGNAAGSVYGSGYTVSTLPDYYLAQAGTVSASVTETYNFMLSNFTNYDGTDASPVNMVNGSVTLTYDPIGTVFDSTTGVTLNSLNGIPLGSAISYSTYRTQTGQELLYLGGLQSGADGINGSTNDFVLALDVTSPGSPVLLKCSSPYESCDAAAGSVYGSGYSVQSLADDYGAQTASVTVPEPASAAIFGIGLAGLAWRRRRSGSAG